MAISYFNLTVLFWGICIVTCITIDEEPTGKYNDKSWGISKMVGPKKQDVFPKNQQAQRKKNKRFYH